MSAETVALDWTYLDWAMAYHTIKGKPISLNDYGFMVEPYEMWDQAQEMVLKFPNQVAKTEWLLGGLLYEADAHGRDVIYYFPHDNEVARMVQSRVDPIIMGNESLRGRVHDTKRKVARVHQKLVNRGWWHAKGASSPLARQGTSADIVGLDELSLFEPIWIEEIYKRLNASDYQRVRKISRPTYVGDLIEEAYLESDQRAWHVQCSCGNRQAPDFFKDVVAQESEYEWALRDTKWTPDSPDDIQVICRKCGKGIDPKGPGVWVAKNPGSQVVGYHVTRLVTATASVRRLYSIFDKAMRQGDEDALTTFYNGDLGLGYTPKSSGLDSEILDGCKGNYLMPSRITSDSAVLVAGIDVQRRYLVVRISRIVRRGSDRIRQAVFLGRVTWDGLDDLFQRFPVKLAVMDSEPETAKAEELQGKFPFLWLADYPSVDNPSRELVDARRSDRFVVAQRNRTLSRSHSEIMVGHNELPKNADRIPDFYDEMTDLVRVEEEDTKGKKRYVWRKRKRDDYRHADNYDFIAAELLDQGMSSRPMVVASEISNRESSLKKLKRGDKRTLR